MATQLLITIQCMRTIIVVNLLVDSLDECNNGRKNNNKNANTRTRTCAVFCNLRLLRVRISVSIDKKGPCAFRGG